MTRLAVTLMSLFLGALPLLASTEVSPDDTWQTYVDNAYQVTLRFPGDWTTDPLYSDRVYFGADKRGSFQLSLMGDATLEHACKEGAMHKLRPFGENPTVRQMTVQGQSACLVWPSEDQGAPWYAQVIIEYPKPVEVDGDLWSLLMMDADKNYILAITQTLRFITATQQNAPFLMEIAPRNPKNPGTATWKAGTPVSLTLKMKNNSDRVLQFILSSPVSDYRMTILDSRHDRVPITENFFQMEEDLKMGRGPTRKNAVTLKPNQTYQDSIEITNLYELGRPDEYSVQVERDLPPELGKGIVRSNTINLKVVD
jgi:TolB protein